MTNNGTPTTPATATPPTDVSPYLDRFRGRAPSEMLGLPRESSLIGPFLVATVTTGVLFAALTVIPYMFGKSEPAPAVAATPADQPPPEAPKPSTPAATPKTPDAAPKTPEATSTATTATPPKSPAIVGKLKEDEVKIASPKVNPLDKKEDDILKDLDK